MEKRALDKKIMSLVELQIHGIRGQFEHMGRKGGAGPTDAKAFVFGSNTLMVPTQNRPAKRSHFTIEPSCDGLRIMRHGEVIETVKEVPRPRFYDLETEDGISYQKIARLHGADCLASTVVQECIRYNDPKKRCHFCAIGVSLDSGATIHTKTPAQLAEVAAVAKRLDGISHMTLTTGTTNNHDKGAIYLGECAHMIKRQTGLPIQVQFEPVDDPRIFSELKKAGVDCVGMHIESFDAKIRKKFTPGKAQIDVETYFSAFEDAVAVFGRNRVSTYVILGLGEDEQLTLEMCERAADIGVYPFVVPLRPLENTYLAKIKPPDFHYLYRIYQSVGEMLRSRHLSLDNSAAGCVKCGACSILQMIEAA